MSADLSASGLFKSDAQLKSLPFDTYSKLASDESIENAKKALEAKTHVVHVVADKKEALEAIKGLIPASSSVNIAGSTTLGEIGFIEYLKGTEHKWKNIHGEILAESDMGKQAELRRQANTCDYFVSSVNAVSESGEIVVVDLTGTRTGPFTHSAGKIIVVIGSNKIVSDYAAAVKRTEEYTLPLESARVRIAYAAMGVQASSINNFVAIKGPNPWGAPGRIQVVIVKEHLGF